jgi:hypothetical protein
MDLSLTRVERASRMNALRPNRMSAAERLEEIAEIIAAGLMRLRARQSSQLSGDDGESSLDCLAIQSGHAKAPLTHEAPSD